MNSLLEPSWTVLTLLFAKRFLYIEALFVLACLRVWTSRGAARWGAALAALAAALAIAGVFAPALKLTAGAWYGPVARVLNAGGGLAVPIAISVLLAATAFLPGRRRRWIDGAHALLALALFALWLATRLG